MNQLKKIERVIDADLVVFVAKALAAMTRLNARCIQYGLMAHR